MTKPELIKTASKLKQPSITTILEFENKSEQLVSQMNNIMLSRSDISLLIDDDAPMMEYNHRNINKFMTSVFKENKLESFIEDVVWIYKTNRTHGVNLSYFPVDIHQWIELLKKYFSEDSFHEIYPFYNWLITNQSELVNLSNKSSKHGKVY